MEMGFEKARVEMAFLKTGTDPHATGEPIVTVINYIMNHLDDPLEEVGRDHGLAVRGSVCTGDGFSSHPGLPSSPSFLPSPLL
jgi:hypothetical protein